MHVKLLWIKLYTFTVINHPSMLNENCALLYLKLVVQRKRSQELFFIVNDQWLMFQFCICHNNKFACSVTGCMCASGYTWSHKYFSLHLALCQFSPNVSGFLFCFYLRLAIFQVHEHISDVYIGSVCSSDTVSISNMTLKASFFSLFFIFVNINDADCTKNKQSHKFVSIIMWVKGSIYLIWLVELLSWIVLHLHTFICILTEQNRETRNFWNRIEMNLFSFTACQWKIVQQKLETSDTNTNQIHTMNGNRMKKILFLDFQ